MHFELKIFLEPVMFCHLAVSTHLPLWRGRQGKKPKVYLRKTKRIQEFLYFELVGETFLESLTIPNYFLWVKI